jgi:hypothetical protein
VHPLTALAVLIALAWALLGGPARADEPGTTQVTVLPLDGKHRGIVLRAQTVDATLSESDGVVWADTQVWLLLKNPGTVPITVPVTLPGPRVFPGDLPQGLEIRLDGKSLPMTEAAGPEDPQGPALRADIFLGSGKSVQLDLAYRQALPQTGDMAVFAYLSTTAKQWARSPDAVRVTLRLDPAITPAQILSLAPPPRRAHNGELTWHWEGEKDLLNVGLALVPPSRWSALEADRQQASAGEADAGAQMALSRRYMDLTRLPALPFDNADFYERFYPSAAGALQAAAGEAAPDGVSPHVQLALLYRERSAKLGGTASGYYTQLATEEIMRGLAAGARDAETLQLASELFTGALAQAEERGDAAAAEKYRAQLAAIAGEGALLSTEKEQRAFNLAAAALAAERGEVGEARRIATEVMGADATLLPGTPPPTVSAALVDVFTAPDVRRIELAFTGGLAPDGGDPLLADAAAALRNVPQATARAEAGKLIVEIPAGDPGTLAQIQSELVARLPGRPEYALLADVLKPEAVGFAVQEAPLRVVTAFAESVDLGASAALWSDLAGCLEAAAADAEKAAGEAETDDEKRRQSVQAALWRSDAAAWRQLAAASRVVYRVDPGDAQAVRDWTLHPGDAKQLTAQAARWQIEELRAVGAATAAALLALSVVLTAVILAMGRLARKARA